MAEHKKVLSIQGAREHNLKNISIDLPRDKLIVFTGLSGSGKSSLALRIRSMRNFKYPQNLLAKNASRQSNSLLK